MKLKNLEITFELVGFINGEKKVSIEDARLKNVNISLNKTTAKEMVAGMTDREKWTMAKALEENAPHEKDEELWKDAQEILDQLNRITGKKLRGRNPDGKATQSLKLIHYTLKREYTKQQCLAVVNHKSLQGWFRKNNFQYCVPTTLFRASNFDKYVNEIRI